MRRPTQYPWKPGRLDSSGELRVRIIRLGDGPNEHTSPVKYPETENPLWQTVRKGALTVIRPAAADLVISIPSNAGNRPKIRTDIHLTVSLYALSQVAAHASL